MKSVFPFFECDNLYDEYVNFGNDPESMSFLDDVLTFIGVVIFVVC